MAQSNHRTQLPVRVTAGLLPTWGTYLGPPCLGLVAGLLPILVVTPLLGSSLLHPGEAPGASLLDLPTLPLGFWRNGLTLL